MNRVYDNAGDGLSVKKFLSKDAVGSLTTAINAARREATSREDRSSRLASCLFLEMFRVGSLSMGDAWITRVDDRNNEWSDFTDRDEGDR